MVPFWGYYHFHHLFSSLCQCGGIWDSALGELGLQLAGWLRQNLQSLCSFFICKVVIIVAALLPHSIAVRAK